MTGEPKCKQCRREGTKLFLKGEKCFGTKCPVVRRSYAPGVHGPKQIRKKKLFGYAKQLREKQKAKRIYRLNERQFRSYATVAQKKEGDAGRILKHLLEFRLDNVVFRAGFAKSRNMARQLVGHGHVTVNGKRVDIPSYQVSVGETITFNNRAKEKHKLVTNEITKQLEKYQAPSWLQVDATALSAQVTNKPEGDDVEFSFDTQPILEYYSR